MNQPESNDELLPEPLVAALRNSAEKAPEVPQSVRERILANAERQLELSFGRTADGSEEVQPANTPAERSGQGGAADPGLPGQRVRFRMFPAALCSAAAVLLLVVTIQFRNREPRAGTQLAGAVRSADFDQAGSAALSADDSGSVAVEDIDGDGRIDILDAFTLARNLRRGETGPQSADLNGDGSVDDGDVRIIAMRAVML